MKTKCSRHLEACLIAAILAVIPKLAGAAINLDLAVDMTDAAHPKLIIVTNSSQCPDGGLDCIEVVKYSSPNIKFNLEDACDSGSGGPAWKLTEIKIALVNKVWPTTAVPLPSVVASDFNADATTGVIDLNAGKNKLQDDLIKFKNKNSAEYTVFFEITAADCANPPTTFIKLDPSIRNYGK